MENKETNIKFLHLTSHTKMILKDNNITSVERLCDTKQRKIEEMAGLDEFSKEEIYNKLDNYLSGVNDGK